MKLICLGTSSGVPTKNRNVSAYAVLPEKGKDWYLVDCGEGTQHMLLHAPVSLNTLKGIFITHVHGDHCYGLPGLLASAGMNGRTEPLQIVAPSGVKEMMNAIIQNSDLHLGYDIDYVLPEDNEVASIDSKMKVEAIALSHRVPSYAYQFTETDMPVRLNIEKLEADSVPKGSVWGKLHKGEKVSLGGGIELNPEDYLEPPRKARSIIVSGDNDMPSLLMSACEKADVLVHEATYTEVILCKVGGQVQHCSAERIAKFAQNVGLRNLVLTHFSARYSDNPDSRYHTDMILKEARQHYSGNLFKAEDLVTYHLAVDGELKLI